MTAAKARFSYMTSEQLARSDIPDKRTELVRGRLVVREPVRRRHADVMTRMTLEIGGYLTAHPIGRVYAGDPGFTLERNPDTVRAPDIAYIRTERIPTEETEAFDEMAPDLVVEIRSPGDRTGRVQTKVRQWLKAGVRLVWLIDPRRRTAHVYRLDGTETSLAETDVLDGEDVLPGLVVSVAALVSP